MKKEYYHTNIWGGREPVSWWGTTAYPSRDNQDQQVTIPKKEQDYEKH